MRLCFSAWGWRVVCALLVLAAAAQEVWAQHQGMHSRRLVHLFDFEETIEGVPLGRFERLPMHWYVMGRPDASSDPNFLAQPLHQRLMGQPGYSRHSAVRFDSTHTSSGEFSFYLGLDAGSAGAFLQIGTLPAMVDIDYLVQLNVRTSRMRHAAARVVVYFVDGRGERIEESVTRSGPIRTDEAWQQVQVRLIGEHPQAAWIGMQLEVLQAEYDGQAALGENQIVFQEVRGGAWFDDIAVWQLPRVQVRTQSEVNIIRRPHAPELSLEVRDLTGEALTAQVTVYDHADRVVARQERRVGAGEPSTWTWRPTLPRYGWYQTDLQVWPASGSADDATFIARNRIGLLYLDEERALDSVDAVRFGIRAEDLAEDELLKLGQMLRAARLSSAIISAWERETTLVNFDRRHALLERVMQEVMADNGRLTLSFYPLPEELGKRFNLEDRAAADLFGPDFSLVQWSQYLTPMTLRYGQRVQHWQMGSTDAPANPFYRRDLPQRAVNMVRTMTNLAPGPTVVMPWHVHQSRREDMKERVLYALSVPPGVRPQDLYAYARTWRESPAAPVRLDLQPPAATRMAHVDRVEDLTLRMVHGWASGASAITLPRPWTLTEDRTARLTPDPLLGVFTTVTHRLAGRHVIGRLPLGEGLEALIFDGKNGGLIVAWNRFTEPDDARIDMYLGEAPVAVDVFGNRRALSMVDGRHQLELETTPIFIEGIDPQLAMFRARFQFDEPFIESTQTLHHRHVTIYNPWPRTISGQMRVVEPADWQVQPRLTNFSIASGESAVIPLAIKFPVSETAGHKRLVARFDFTSEHHYQLDVSTELSIGLKHVRFEASLLMQDNPQSGRRDAVVTQIITNTGPDPVSLYAFANLTGHTRQERLVARLQPGQTITRRFTFTDAETALAEHPIRAGLRQANGPAVLTHVLTLPQ